MLSLLLPPLFLTFRQSITAVAFAATAPQFANQILGEFNHMFIHYIPSTHVLAFSDIGKVYATGTQRLATHCFGPAPQGWAEAT